MIYANLKRTACLASSNNTAQKENYPYDHMNYTSLTRTSQIQRGGCINL